ncbi:hypothetical protein KP509_32G047600 [Ceratopteris richardii]|uniref:Uncharacterized protein n=1 Tax=Ceratopteris richardii TaxID=49495 RepID=A0A8T2QT25_CERRI|nr:hypothetical protein KP509_32G047600 [Ceratopteris richardii]
MVISLTMLLYFRLSISFFVRVRARIGLEAPVSEGRTDLG